MDGVGVEYISSDGARSAAITPSGYCTKETEGSLAAELAAGGSDGCFGGQTAAAQGARP
jgi:hypothetical protein